MKKHYAISLDELSERIHEHLSTSQDGGAGHYARFDGETKAQAISRALHEVKILFDEMFYESDDYGYRKE